MKTKSHQKESPSRLHRFTFIQLAVFLFIFLSPAFGIHVHHKSESIGTASVIHSYFWEDHESNHPPATSPPESLPDHLNSYGLADNSGSWDIGTQVVSSNFSSASDTIFLYLIFLSTYNTIASEPHITALSSFEKSFLAPVRTTKLQLFYKFFLPPPNRSVS